MQADASSYDWAIRRKDPSGDKGRARSFNDNADESVYEDEFVAFWHLYYREYKKNVKMSKVFKEHNESDIIKSGIRLVSAFLPNNRIRIFRIVQKFTNRR